MMKIEGSLSISQRYGSADPDPHQNVMDPQHCLVPKAQLERCAPYCAIGYWVPYCQLLFLVRDGAVAIKGSHTMGDGRIISKNLRASLFNDDLSNEPNFLRIHLAGQYL